MSFIGRELSTKVLKCCLNPHYFTEQAERRRSFLSAPSHQMNGKQQKHPAAVWCLLNEGWQGGNAPQQRSLAPWLEHLMCWSWNWKVFNKLSITARNIYANERGRTVWSQTGILALMRTYWFCTNNGRESDDCLFRHYRDSLFDHFCQHENRKLWGECDEQWACQ